MEKRKVVVHFLVPANQYPAKAIPPTMRALHHPASRSEARLAFDGLGFFPPRPDMRCEAKLLYRLPHFLIVLPFVQTHPLRALLGGAGPGNAHAVDGGFDQLHVGPIGPGYHQAHWHSLPCGQQAALDPAFGPIGGIGAGFFPPQAEPSSSPRPCSASSSLTPLAHQIAPPPLATASGTPPPPPIPESGRGRWNGNINRWRPMPPTDSPGARRRRWRRHTNDPEPGVAPHQSGACFRAWARLPAARSRVHPRPGSWSSLCSRPPAGAFLPSLLLVSCSVGYQKVVIRIGS
jgi:hypothetical protein